MTQLLRSSKPRTFEIFLLLRHLLSRNTKTCDRVTLHSPPHIPLTSQILLSLVICRKCFACKTIPIGQNGKCFTNVYFLNDPCCHLSIDIMESKKIACHSCEMKTATETICPCCRSKSCKPECSCVNNCRCFDAHSSVDKRQSCKNKAYTSYKCVCGNKCQCCDSEACKSSSKCVCGEKCQCCDSEACKSSSKCVCGEKCQSYNNEA
ncbi:hypothetical protein NPIL_483831 [Nephila pilipes]|uniref:Uncharacterized protein n=1 Tax=Nephila pilipes TaxID=299642 RepID=A0A8X6UTA4_NEPPI|nr:hypothetical protein NPIL_483831 [Nephila pilipes]